MKSLLPASRRRTTALLSHSSKRSCQSCGRRIFLSASLLRAYGLTDEMLEEMSSVRNTSLTFAPEAGTQRMRDVVNKNITEDDIAKSAHRIFPEVGAG